MAIIKCKMCGGDMLLNAEKTIGTCEYCGSQMTLPKVSDDQRAAQFNRGNHFRRSGEFDKALAIYENIVREDDSDAEAHWCCALCRFGIEYVEDPNTFEFIPTCHRASFDSFLEDVDYLAALEHSDGITRRQYQKDAAKIAEVQKGILATSRNEEPFDVFLCYKETDDNTKERTKDSIDAQEIYYQLTNEGYRVFFSRITLEDKAGTEYEPYIFAALNSAKVMVAIGSKPEYFNAVWVKNEWSRYLSLMRKDRSKLLLPCYKNMDPYDLPDQLSVLQSYDMSKIGFMQDLIRGIKKVLAKDEPKEQVKETVIVQQNAAAGVAPLLKRAFMYLEDGAWQNADEYAEKVLDQDPENAEAYLAKLMAELKVRNRNALNDQPQPFDGSSNYKKALRFGNDKLKTELSGCTAHIIGRNKDSVYRNALSKMKSAASEGDFKKAAEDFRTIPGWRDADALAGQCLEKAEVCRKDAIYTKAAETMNRAAAEEDYKKAAEDFRTIPGWKDADSLIAECLEKAETQRKIAEQKIQAVILALKQSVKPKSGPTLEERLTAAKTKVGYLESILSVFNATQSQIRALQSEYNTALSQEKQLVDQRSRLGIFAGREKKRIDEEIAAVAARKNGLAARIDQNRKSLGNYSSAQDIERDLREARKNTNVIESQIEREQGNACHEYSFEEALNIYQNEQDVAAGVNKIYPAACLIPAITGKVQTLYFGRYVQKRNGSPEPIEWQVLARENGRMLVISKYALDHQKYNASRPDVTWETCSLRKWLNGTFLNAAFSESERAMIPSVSVSADRNPSYSTNPGNSTTDQVFLLSITEANKYFSSDSARQCQGTAYCCAQGAYKADNGNCWWWLRSPGYDSIHAAHVNIDGSVLNYGYFVLHDDVAVRPALWIVLGDN